MYLITMKFGSSWACTSTYVYWLCHRLTTKDVPDAILFGQVWSHAVLCLLVVSYLNMKLKKISLCDYPPTLKVDLLPDTPVGFRKISHSLNFFSLYDGEKECRGTLFFPILLQWGKSVGFTFKFSPYWRRKRVSLSSHCALLPLRPLLAPPLLPLRPLLAPPLSWDLFLSLPFLPFRTLLAPPLILSLRSLLASPPPPPLETSSCPSPPLRSLLVPPLPPLENSSCPSPHPPLKISSCLSPSSSPWDVFLPLPLLLPLRLLSILSYHCPLFLPLPHLPFSILSPPLSSSSPCLPIFLLPLLSFPCLSILPPLHVHSKECPFSDKNISMTSCNSVQVMVAMRSELEINLNLIDEITWDDVWY